MCFDRGGEYVKKLSPLIYPSLACDLLISIHVVNENEYLIGHGKYKLCSTQLHMV